MLRDQELVPRTNICSISIQFNSMLVFSAENSESNKA